MPMLALILITLGLVSLVPSNSASAASYSRPFDFSDVLYGNTSFSVTKGRSYTFVFTGVKCTPIVGTCTGLTDGAFNVGIEQRSCGTFSCSNTIKSNVGTISIYQNTATLVPTFTGTAYLEMIVVNPERWQGTVSWTA